MKNTTRYILYVLVLMLVVYIALLDTLAKPLFEQQATEMYGAEVSVDSVKVSPFVGKITLYNLAVADRSNAMRNLANASRAYIDIDIIKLANDIIEIDTMELEGLEIFGRRERAANILRPLVPKGSAIAKIDLPAFTLPNPDALVARQRDKYLADIKLLEKSFADSKLKWQGRMESLPRAEDVAAYRLRIDKLRRADSPQIRQEIAQQSRELFAEIKRDINRMRGMGQEFRGDMAHLREQVVLANALPAKHSRELIQSLGLSSAQIARWGTQILRGDLSGIMQQVLAPLAYTEAGQISTTDNNPIYIQQATISGPLLASATALVVNGQLHNFVWPLELAESPATLDLTGTSTAGGSLLIKATLDHSGKAADTVSIDIDGLTLQNMQLTGSENLTVQLAQALASIAGELRVEGEKLSGNIHQSYKDAVFETQLDNDAGDAARLISSVLRGSNKTTQELSFSGTVFEPEISFSTDMSQLIQQQVRDRIAEQVSGLTADLQNRISNQLGPQIAAARAQMAGLQDLEAQLQRNLGELDQLSR